MRCVGMNGMMAARRIGGLGFVYFVDAGGMTISQQMTNLGYG